MDTDYGVKTYQGRAKKGEKETFYCNLCKVELNSRETRNSHMQGSIHRAKEQRGEYPPEEAVVRIPNPVARRKKIPVRLEAKVSV